MKIVMLCIPKLASSLSAVYCSDVRTVFRVYKIARLPTEFYFATSDGLQIGR